MKNTFGNSITVTLFGESHGPFIGCVLDGLCPGLPVGEDSIREALSKRRPHRTGETARTEADEFFIISGTYQGKTTGTPLCITIANGDVKSADYDNLQGIARPGHGDITAHEKYHGFEDPRGGGHGSGRLTAALVAAGAVLTDALSNKGIQLASHLRAVGGIPDRPFDEANWEEDFYKLFMSDFPVLDDGAGMAMQQTIACAQQMGESLGGVIETAVLGLPAGVGEPWFDTVEGALSHALFSIPAVKGVEFGDGFALANMRGSVSNDAMHMDPTGGRVVTDTNHMGGILGGITNGMPLTFRCAVKPTPSIAKEQNTVNFIDHKDCTVSVAGRHDACVAPRALPVVNAVTALVLADLLAARFGTDWFLSAQN